MWPKYAVCEQNRELVLLVLLQYLSRLSLHSLAGLPSLLLFYGLQMLTREVHRSSLRRLMWRAQDHFIFPTLQIMFGPDAGLSILVYNVEHTSFHFWSVRPHVCSVLGWSVSRSLHPNVISGSCRRDSSGRWQGCFL